MDGTRMYVLPSAEQTQSRTAKKNGRVGAPKVKSGCKSCKISHLKCDEKKPICGRCQRRKTICIFPTALTRADKIAEAKQGPLKILLPAKASSTSDSGFTSNVRRVVQLQHPTGVAPLSPQSVLYFDKFRSFVAVRRYTYGESEFWSRTVLRESTRDECIRHGLVALGALMRTLDDLERAHTQKKISTPRLPIFKVRLNAPSGNIAASKTLSPSQDHYYQAVLHYTKAISLLRKQLENFKDGCNGRAILTATILLCTFENLQGNVDGADGLAAHCLFLLRDFLMCGSLATKTTQAQQNPKQDSLIARLLDDDGILDAEAELVRNTCTNAAFSPLNPQARRVFHQLPVPTFTGMPPPAPPASLQSFSRAWDRLLAMLCVWCYRVKTSTDMPALLRSKYEDEQFGLLAVLSQWRTAVRGRQCTTAEGYCTAAVKEHADYRRIAIAIEGTIYSVRAVFDPSGRAWDDDETATAELLGQCEAVMRARPPGGEHDLRDQSITYGGLATVVAQITWKCRLPRLRRRAICIWCSIISDTSPWDVQGAFLAAKAVVDAEEELWDPIRDGECIPLNKLFILQGGAWNDNFTEFKVTLKPRIPGEDGLVSTKEVVLYTRDICKGERIQRECDGC